jgi:hypothetical protein
MFGRINLMDVFEKQEQLNKIFEESGVVLAYVFGSASRGVAGPLSDLDFAVLFSNEVDPGDYFDKELKIAGEIGGLFNIDRVDVINLKTAKSPLLKHNAVFGGKAVFVKDEKRRFALERGIMQEYEDTQYLRSVQHHYLSKHIKEGSFGRGRLARKSKYLEKYVSH